MRGGFGPPCAGGIGQPLKMHVLRNGSHVRVSCINHKPTCVFKPHCQQPRWDQAGMTVEPAGLNKSLDELIKERGRDPPRGGGFRGGRSSGRGGRGRGFGPQGGIEKRDGSVGGRGQFHQAHRGGRGGFRGGFRGGRNAGRGSDQHRQTAANFHHHQQRPHQDLGFRSANGRGRGSQGGHRAAPQMQQMPPVFGQGNFFPQMVMQPNLGLQAQEVLVEDMVEQEAAPQFEVYLTEDEHVCANMEGTDIVTISPQGSVFLDTGGYYTEDVMASMNQALAPIGLQVTAFGAVEEGNWQVRGGGMLIRFTDGMEIPAKGPQSAGRGRAVLNAFDPQAQELARAAAAASSAAALTSGIAAPAAARMAQGLFAHGAGALNPAGALAIHQRLQQAGLSMEEVLAVAASAGAGLAPGIAPAMPTAAGLATGVRAPAVKPALGNAQMVGGAAAGRGGGTAQGLGMQSEVARRLRAQGRLE